MSAAKASTPKGSAPPAIADHSVGRPSIDAAVHAERIDMLCGTPAVLLFNPANAAITAAVLWHVYPVWIILLWLALFVLVVAGRWLARQSYLRQDPAARAATRWDRRFVLGASVTGLLWGLAASVVFMTDHVGYHVFITFMLGGMMAGALLQNAGYWPAFLGFATLAVAPQIAAYLFRGDQLSLAMGVMLAAYATVVVVTGRRISRWIGETLRLRFAQMELTADLRDRVAENAAANATLLRREASLQQSEARFRAIFESVSDVIFLQDIETLAIVEVNQRGCGVFGYSREEILRLNLADMCENVSPYTINELMPKLDAARAGTPQIFKWRSKAKSGQLIWIELSLRRVAIGGHDFLLATARDISDQKEAEARLARLARFDPLTGLANRSVFVESLEQRIAHSQRQRDGFAVLYLDLDHFKDVNDTLGHPIGDQLLQAVAQRLEANVRATDIVARFGGDEFAVLAAGTADPEDAGVLATKLLAVLSEPYLIDGHQIHGGASIGIAVGDPAAVDAEALLSRADVALYQAKAAGRQAFRLFTDAMSAELHSRVTLAAELRDAIDRGQLFLDYQPQVDVTTGRIAGVEALVRWRHPVRGVISPGIFIPAAEKSGVIVPLGRWVLREACRQARCWIDLGIAPACVAVNVSALQFKAWLELEKDIEVALAEFRVPPGMLELEMTESALMETSREHYAFLDRLRAKGVRLAIDDFGTGYSSLLYLRRFPVNRLKIAQEFVSDLVTDPNDAAIVLAAIRLARALGLDVIAEGVETVEQLSLLSKWGCRDMQGFYFAKPMSPETIAPLLHSGEICRETPIAVAV